MTATSELLEADVGNGKLIFTPKSFVGRHINEGLGNARNGKTHAPYATVKDAMQGLED